ncbi:ABC transporter substrate-binding protein [Paenibacillus sp. Soil766]|uniref:ABC transporter substrate-binding protein n=1 Tax=Paenibacillus sp. Soil766 TaxID=1736404 RepID=UPI0009E7D177|nr:ABC transporter substrate-binding protein [Paenibacillus sp. Soil766]
MTTITIKNERRSTYINHSSLGWKRFLTFLIYFDLPKQVEQAKAQDAISVESLAAMNPDYLFLQFSTSENKGTEYALKELKNNPVLKKTNAFSNNHVFVNAIDPLMEGGRNQKMSRI